MAEAPTQSAKRSPASLEIDDVVRLLRASGSRHASAERVRADIDAGAPTNPSSTGEVTINLVHYAAWLARQAAASEATRVH